MDALITITGMKFFAYHGCYAFERENGGWYTVDVAVTTDVTRAAEADELSGTVNYEVVYSSVAAVMQVPVKLLEHLAYKIVMDLRSSFPASGSIRVTVHKHQPPLAGEVEETSVTITG